MQSCHMAFDEVGEDAVYLCTGNPMPRDIEEIVRLLFNAPLAEAFSSECQRRVQGSRFRVQGAPLARGLLH